MNGKNEHNIADIIWNLEKENEELKAEIRGLEAMLSDIVFSFENLENGIYRFIDVKSVVRRYRKYLSKPRIKNRNK